ncbi:sodium/bile acid cotransporter 4 [Stegostoma tigrinum]|uniref:sodium/bile acid cotransporter 4 n=1 Tax=Stegostoma tigrinum TaxID=3053191 RepID=UPI00202B9A04|nr:sodium/bile acid cotransporter 4 [Stegostoma tigrinum]
MENDTSAENVTWEAPTSSAMLNLTDYRNGTAVNVSNVTGVEVTSAWSQGASASDDVDRAPVVWAAWEPLLSQWINVLVAGVLSITMLGLGCTVQVRQLGQHLRSPVAPLLAAASQFVIMPLVAFLLALAFSLGEVAATAVLLCGCCPGGNLSNILSLLVHGDMNLSIIMTISSTLLALLLMPLCLWIYSRAWINTPVVQLMPFGAIILTLCGTLIPIGLGVFIRYRYNRAADFLLKVSLWSLMVTLILLFILTGTLLGPDLLAAIPASVYIVALLMPLAGYVAGYGLGTLFNLPANCKRTVSLGTGCQNVQLCTAILKLAFPPQVIGGIYMLPLLYALFQVTEAGVFVLAYKIHRRNIAPMEKPADLDADTDISYKKLKEEEVTDSSYGAVSETRQHAVITEPPTSETQM